MPPLCTRSQVIAGDTHPHRHHAYPHPALAARCDVFFGAILWRSIAQPAAGPNKVWHAVKATCGLRSAFIPPATAQILWKRLRRSFLNAPPREHNRSTGPQARQWAA